ncbi:hypothetical protein FQR65_LT06780 [Abscondita terminalis]|nr:hypothetical protein FQR65_LT06780 [Abscondita terminalis]
MRYIVGVCIALLFFEVYGDDKYFLELRENVMSPYINECICATKVKEILVQKWFTLGEFTNDPCLKCFVKCMSIKVGFIDEMGTPSVNTAVTKYHAPPELIKKCIDNNKNILDICEKSYRIGQCVVSGMLSKN